MPKQSESTAARPGEEFIYLNYCLLLYLDSYKLLGYYLSGTSLLFINKDIRIAMTWHKIFMLPRQLKFKIIPFSGLISLLYAFVNFTIYTNLWVHISFKDSFSFPNSVKHRNITVQLVESSTRSTSD